MFGWGPFDIGRACFQFLYKTKEYLWGIKNPHYLFVLFVSFVLDLIHTVKGTERALCLPAGATLYGHPQLVTLVADLEA